MNLFTALDVNAGGLTAQRKRAEVASSNLANAQTTRTPDGGPYRRTDVVFETTGFADSPASVLDRGVEHQRQCEMINRTLDLGKY
jgi:flagellar basal-body rod protein FlgC